MMKKKQVLNKKISNNGITLIALVVTIIVLIILAGVSFNVLINNNGIIKKATYGSFLSKMSAVEEKISLWIYSNNMEKNNEVVEIPSKNLCNDKIIEEQKRLIGEICYYRIWNTTGIKPEEDIFSMSDEEFDNKYKGELVYFPQGIQDLYYIDNEKIEENSKEKYLIDATNGMIYIVDGANINGIEVHSLNMAKQIEGTLSNPKFLSIEVKATNQASTVEEMQYKIITNEYSDNIFKLYNNGDLYGKGIKGVQLNTSCEEMNKINEYIWNEFTIPNNIPGSNTKQIKLFPGCASNIFILDSNSELWALGKNECNMFGLTKEQQVSYTGREVIKLNVDGKKVKQVYAGIRSTFVITTDNYLYAAGSNINGELGLGHKNEIEKFTKVEVTNVDKIVNMMVDSSDNVFVNIIQYEDNTYYATGLDKTGSLGLGSNNIIFTRFTKIWDGNLGPDIDQDILDICLDAASVILKKDGSVLGAGFRGYIGGSLAGSNNYEFNEYPITNVKKIYKIRNAGIFFECEDENKQKQYYGTASKKTAPWGKNQNTSEILTKIEMPKELIEDGIKEIYTVRETIYYIANSGKVWASGQNSFIGMNKQSSWSENIEYTGLDNIETAYDKNVYVGNGSKYIALLKGKDGKYYSTGAKELIFRDNILQSNWKLIAKNVLYFDAKSTCYVDKNNNLWVAGRSSALGLGEKSKTDDIIQNYILNDDENIQGKVSEVQMKDELTIIKTTNGELWATGKYQSDTGVQYYPGWSEKENKLRFTKILDNVIFWDMMGRYYEKIVATTNGLYVWGENYNAGIGLTQKNIYTPTKLELNTDFGDISKIKQLNVGVGFRATLLSEKNEVWKTGTHIEFYDGGATPTNYFSKYTYNLNLQNDEKIDNFITSDGNLTIFITNKGNVYGYGPSNELGINSTSTELIETQKLLIDNVAYMTEGKGFIIAVKKDGTVWATGSNKYGVLGRWLGINRKEQNSRYKTAFEWVECPELEI